MSDVVVRKVDELRARKAESVDFLSFIMADELYAVELRSVQEIVVPPPITPVPRSPKAVSGVCSVRGQLVTVVDLRSAFGLPPIEEDKRRRILLGKGAEDEVIGLRVDDVCQVVRLLPSELELTAQSLGGEVSEAVRGIGRPSGGDVLVLLDMETVLRRGTS